MSFTGKYNIVMHVPTGDQEAVLELVQDGETLSGTMEAQGEKGPIDNPRIEGDTAHWDIDITKPMPLTLNFRATKDGDSLSGKVALGMFGEADFEGSAA